MSKRVENGLEILVHAAAPSRGKDDTRYRALASEYLTFGPFNIVGLSDSIQDSDEQALDDQADGQLREELLQATPKTFQSHVKPDDRDEDENDNYRSSQSQPQALLYKKYMTRSVLRRISNLESPQVSFNSVFDNADSPNISRPALIPETPPVSRNAQKLPVPSNEASWSTPPSIIADSQPPIDTPVPEVSSPTRVLELYLQHFDDSKLPPSAETKSGDTRPEEDPSLSIVRSSLPQLERSIINQTPDQSPALVQAPIELLSSPSEHKIEAAMPRGNYKRRFSADNALAPKKRPTCDSSGRFQHVIPRSTCPDQTTPTQQSTHCSPIPKRRRPSETTDIAQLGSNEPANIITQTPKSFAKLTSTEIFPPPPKASTSSTLPPLITPSLAIFATQLSLPVRFQPLSQSRPVRNLERGYWTLSLATWDAKLRARSWKALETFVGEGKAGWGVWCTKTASQSPKKRKGKNHTVGVDGVRGRQLELVKDAAGEDVGGLAMDLRIYCWGEVVGHIYLLLYLVSERKVKGAGARWVDAGGEPIIIMA